MCINISTSCTIKVFHLILIVDEVQHNFKVNYVKSTSVVELGKFALWGDVKHTNNGKVEQSSHLSGALHTDTKEIKS